MTAFSPIAPTASGRPAVHALGHSGYSVKALPEHCSVITLHHSRVIPRPYQSAAADHGARALNRNGNTLHLLPTGAGKTVAALLTAAAAGFNRLLVLVHRDELVAQWLAAVALVLPQLATSTVTAAGRDWSGRIVVAMVPTLSRPAALAEMPSFDLVIVDEAHHAVAGSWQAILRGASQRHSGVRVYGCTATPERGDGMGLRRVFDNVSFAISLRELVEQGFLVPPNAFALDLVLAAEMDMATRTAADAGEQNEVATLLNTTATNRQAVEWWQEKAAERRTIVFAATVPHAVALAGAWTAAGVRAECLTGETRPRERAAILGRLASGETQVVTNCAVLVEGFDEPLVDCVVLARACSCKSTLIQMAGRALRTVDAARYPGVIKTDAVIIDFGRSLARHGDLLASACLDDRPTGPAPVKSCPSCNAALPINLMACPLCGHDFEPRFDPSEPGAAVNSALGASLVSVDVLGRSPFAWTEIGADTMVAAGFSAQAVVRRIGDRWVSVGLVKVPNQWRPLVVPLRVGSSPQVFAAADDFMRARETSGAAHKAKSWMREPPTIAQLEQLARRRISATNLTKYSASVRLTCAWHGQDIMAGIGRALAKS